MKRILTVWRVDDLSVQPVVACTDRVPLDALKVLPPEEGMPTGIFGRSILLDSFHKEEIAELGGQGLNHLLGCLVPVGIRLPSP